MSTVQFAGFSRLNGELKFRTANDTKRIDQLRKLGDTDVVILQLPTDMSKTEAAEYVLNNLAISYTDFDTAEARDLLNSIVGRTVKIKRPVKVTVPSTARVKLTGARVKVEPVEKKLTAKQAARNREEWNRAHAHLSYDGE